MDSTPQQTPAEVTSRLANVAEGDSLSLLLSAPMEDTFEATVRNPDSDGGPNTVPANRINIEMEVSEEIYKDISVRMHEFSTGDEMQPLHVVRLENPSDAMNSIPDDDETPGVVKQETVDTEDVVQHMTDMTFPDTDRGYPIAKIEVPSPEEGEDLFNVIAGEVRAVESN